MGKKEQTIEEQIAEKDAAIAQLEKEVEALKKANADLQGRAESAASNTPKKHPTAKVDGTTYEVVSPRFLHPKTDQPVTAEEAAKDKDLMALLVKIRSGNIRAK